MVDMNEGSRVYRDWSAGNGGRWLLRFLDNKVWSILSKARLILLLNRGGQV